MAIVPRALRPSVVIRRKAMRQGVLGRSAFWKVVAVFVFGRATLKRTFGRNPEPLGKRTIGTSHMISVAVTPALTRKMAKRAGVDKASLEAQAWSELDAAQNSS